MALVEKNGRFEIWSVDGEFWVYGYYASGDPKICATIGAACAYCH